MKILAIDTSCDETSVAVTEGVYIDSNIIWSQAVHHAQFGGVMPNLAQRMHRERIDWVIDKALSRSRSVFTDLKAVAVTTGPGLAIALEVGIAIAKEIAGKYQLPLIPINHIEGHLLSPLARKSPGSKLSEKSEVRFPALGLVVSGGHTELVLIEQIGKYQILAQTADDALGEALDKAARLLGLGYPGGPLLEKMARLGDPKAFSLPLPMSRSAEKNIFSYSGLKTAFYRLVNSLTSTNELNKFQIYNLAASFQNRAFQHLIRVCTDQLAIITSQHRIKDLLIGGGVAANIELRKRLREMGSKIGLTIHLPYSTKLIGDNAAMIGISAGFKNINNPLYKKYNLVDRKPGWKIDELG